MKLYEGIGELEKIDELMLALVDEDGVIRESEEIESLEEELYEKIEKKTDSIIKVIRNSEAENQMLDVEVKRLNDLKKSNTSKIKNLMSYVKYFMCSTGNKKLESPLGRFALRDSERVEILSEELIPKEFITFEPKYSKANIKKELKKGTKVDGAILSINRTISLK